MHKHLTCECGYVVHADSDDDMVRKTQEHMRTVHRKNITREDVLKMAKEAKH
jgi:predicted small metal-binding protein